MTEVIFRQVTRFGVQARYLRNVLKPCEVKLTVPAIEYCSHLFQQFRSTIGLVEHCRARVQHAVMNDGILGIARGEKNLNVWMYLFGFFCDLDAVQSLVCRVWHRF